MPITEPPGPRPNLGDPAFWQGRARDQLQDCLFSLQMAANLVKYGDLRMVHVNQFTEQLDGKAFEELRAEARKVWDSCQRYDSWGDVVGTADANGWQSTEPATP